MKNAVAVAAGLLLSACVTPGVDHLAQREAEMRRRDAAVRSARDRCSEALAKAEGTTLFVNAAIMDGKACPHLPGLVMDLAEDLHSISSACDDPRLEGDVVKMDQPIISEGVEDSQGRLSLLCQ